MKKILFVVFLIGLSLKMVAQNEDWRDPAYSDYKRHGEYMVNVTPLIAQLVPFNASTLSSKNWFDYQYRRLKNGKGFRYGLGLNVTGGDNDPDQFIYLRIGYQRKRQLTKHFHISRSWDLNALAENNQFRGGGGNRANFSGLGISYSLGIEYSFNQRISLSTEGTLFLGALPFNEGPPKLEFVPPVGLFIHVRL
jgi:hypothetical protein